jgi:hypothetical protein
MKEGRIWEENNKEELWEESATWRGYLHEVGMSWAEEDAGCQACSVPMGH